MTKKLRFLFNLLFIGKAYRCIIQLRNFLTHILVFHLLGSTLILRSVIIVEIRDSILSNVLIEHSSNSERGEYSSHAGQDRLHVLLTDERGALSIRRLRAIV